MRSTETFILLALQRMPTYRVGVCGNGESVARLLASPGVLPTDVDASFVGVPLETVDHIEQTMDAAGRRLILTSDEPRYLVEYKPMPDLLFKYKTYVVGSCVVRKCQFLICASLVLVFLFS